MRTDKLQVVRADDRELFLPPQFFLEAYSLLVEHVYLSRKPASEGEPLHKLRRRGVTIPVRDYRAYRKLRRVDGELRELAHKILGFLDEP